MAPVEFGAQSATDAETGVAPQLGKGRSLRDLVRSFGFLAAASILGQTIGFAVLAFVTRRVDPSILGAYYLCIAIVTYCRLPVGLGMPILAMREVSQERNRTQHILGEVLVAQSVTSAIIVISLILLAPTLSSGSASVEVLLPIVALTLLFEAASLEYALQALQAAKSLALWRVTGQVVYALLAFLLITKGLEGAKTYAILNVVGVAVTAAGASISVVRISGWPTLVTTPRRLCRRIRASVPFGASLAMIQTYSVLGVLLLGYLGSAREVGLFGVAQKVPQVLIVMVGIWTSVLYPHASAMVNVEPERLLTQIEKVASYVLVFLPLILVTAIVSGSDLMAFMFGRDYRAAAAPFTVLAGLSTIVFLSLTLLNFVFALGHERRGFGFVFLGAVAAVALNFALIPRLGAIAPAIATCVAEVIVLSLSARHIAHTVGRFRPRAGPLLRSLPACAALAGVLVGTPSGMPVVLRILAGLIAYGALAAACGVVSLRGLKRDEGVS